MFSLSAPCELLFLLCFIASLTLVVVSVMLYPCIVCVTLLMDLFVLCVASLTVFGNCLVKQKETHDYLKGSHETGSVVCLFHMVASCILDQH